MSGSSRGADRTDTAARGWFGLPWPRKRKPRAKEGGGDSIRTVLWALAIALFIRTFLVQAFRIPSGSMEDTLLVGDFLLVDKVTYGATIPGTDLRLPGFREPRRGDIMVFKEWGSNRDFIKRCVATEGDVLEVRNNAVYIDGRGLIEPYKSVKAGLSPFANYGPRRIPDDNVFMMGDNRNNSLDSRAPQHGPLPMKRVVGRAFVLYWSTDPSRSPGWVKSMPENWVKGFLQLFLGRPRITRFGTWLAKDWTDVYATRPGGAPGE